MRHAVSQQEIRRSVHSQNERTKQLTVQRHSRHHPQPVKSRLHSCNSFVSTSRPLLCKPAEARVAKWQEQWEATQSNLKKYGQRNNSRVVTHGRWPIECARDRLPPRQQSICGASGRAKPVCATCYLGHIMTNCRHFGERPNRDGIEGMEDRAVQWMNAVADTI